MPSETQIKQPSLSACDIYRTHAIITRSQFETALDYKPRILGSKIEEFPFVVHKLSAILTALQYKPQRLLMKRVRNSKMYCKLENKNVHKYCEIEKQK